MWVKKFLGQSQSSSSAYVIGLNDDGSFGCGCPAWKYPKDGVRKDCKHIDALNRSGKKGLELAHQAYLEAERRGELPSQIKAAALAQPKPNKADWKRYATRDGVMNPPATERLMQRPAPDWVKAKQPDIGSMLKAPVRIIELSSKGWR